LISFTPALLAGQQMKGKRKTKTESCMVYLQNNRQALVTNDKLSSFGTNINHCISNQRKYVGYAILLTVTT
jgi:hypothetical protein